LETAKAPSGPVPTRKSGRATSSSLWQAALADLERGVPFAEAAERHSDCKGNGGDLGEFPPGHMAEEFEAAIAVLQPGQRTGIFTTPFGFHIAELRAKVPGGPPPFEKVRPDIEVAFTTRNQQELHLRAVAELRSQADIRHVAEESSITHPRTYPPLKPNAQRQPVRRTAIVGVLSSPRGKNGIRTSSGLSNNVTDAHKNRESRKKPVKIPFEANK